MDSSRLKSGEDTQELWGGKTDLFIDSKYLKTSWWVRALFPHSVLSKFDIMQLKLFELLAVNFILLISTPGYVTGAEFWGIFGSSSFLAAPKSGR